MRFSDIEELSTPAGAYGEKILQVHRFITRCSFSNLGSYAGAGYLISTLNNTGKVSEYARWLDLDEAIAHTTWSQSNVTYIR